MYLLCAGACAAFVWYTLYHNPAIGWVIGSVTLICLLAICFGFWAIRAQHQRYRARTKAFYLKLGAEISLTNADVANSATIQSHPSSETVTVRMRMYTVPQTIELTLMSMYQTPRNSLAFGILSLLISLSLLLNNWPPSIVRLICVLAVASAFNGLLVAIVSIGARRVQKKLWKGKGEAIVAISSRGVEIRQDGQAGSVLPWTSIDGIRETGSWMLFMRERRSIIALPIGGVPEQSISQLREILRAAKG
jgi:hypothetical protein